MSAFSYQTQYSAKTAKEAFEGAKRTAQDFLDRGEFETFAPASIARTYFFEMERPNPGETLAACEKRILADPDHWCQEEDQVAACLDAGPDPQQPGLRIFRFVGYGST